MEEEFYTGADPVDSTLGPLARANREALHREGGELIRALHWLESGLRDNTHRRAPGPASPEDSA